MKAKYTLSRKAANEVRKSPQMRAALKRVADEIAARAGDGFDAKVVEGRDRDRAYVSAATAAARKRQARDHVLERAAGGGL